MNFLFRGLEHKMEWRIFFPLLKNDVPSIDIIAHLFKQKARYSPELRTDEYIVMPSVQYGLKLRNTTSHRPLLELKVRSKIESNGKNNSDNFLTIRRYRALVQSDCRTFTWIKKCNPKFDLFNCTRLRLI